jgi:hypothetical protein
VGENDAHQGRFSWQPAFFLGGPCVTAAFFLHRCRAYMTDRAGVASSVQPTMLFVIAQKANYTLTFRH